MAFADPKRKNWDEFRDQTRNFTETLYLESIFTKKNAAPVPDGNYSIIGAYLEPGSKSFVDPITKKRCVGIQMHLLLEDMDGKKYNLLEIVNNEFQMIFKEASNLIENKKLKIKNGLIAQDEMDNLASWNQIESEYATEPTPARNMIRISKALELKKLIMLSPDMVYTVDQVKKYRPLEISNSSYIMIEADLTARQLGQSNEDTWEGKELSCKFIAHFIANNIQNFERAERLGFFLASLIGKEFTPSYSLPAICYSPKTPEIMECIGDKNWPVFKRGHLYRLDDVEKEGEQKIILHATEMPNKDLPKYQTSNKKEASRPKIEVGIPTIQRCPKIKFEIHAYDTILKDEEWFGVRTQESVFNYFKKYIDMASGKDNKFVSLMVETNIYPGELNFMDVNFNDNERHMSDIFMLNVVEYDDIKVRHIIANATGENFYEGLLR